MNVLIVCSGNKGRISAFIEEQVAALNSKAIKTDYFFIQGKGIKGYFSNYRRLLKTISNGNYSLIHAHYGLSGLLAVLQRKIPVVITFHGSDVNKPTVHKFSKLASKLSSFNILVEKSFKKKLGLTKKYTVMPCGVDLDVFTLLDKTIERKKFSFTDAEKIILFSSGFDNKVKNYPLAKEAVDQLPGARLIELKEFTRPEINSLMNAADMLLLTSFSEGSPQVIKEALCCNLPIITTRVGDVSSILANTTGNYIVDYKASEIIDAAKQIMQSGTRTNGRETITGRYDNKNIADKLIAIYQSVKN
jgi:teichuronic acid biosynthesis glycosyltransferase TuaC